MNKLHFVDIKYYSTLIIEPIMTFEYNGIAYNILYYSIIVLYIIVLVNIFLFNFGSITTLVYIETSFTRKIQEDTHKHTIKYTNTHFIW